MKKWGVLALILASWSAGATVDGHDAAYIVVQNVQSEEFFVERVPIIGCYGSLKDPQLVQLTTEYKATSNIGCGGPTFYDNINYLTCAKVVSTKATDDFMSYTEINLDVSKCTAAGEAGFVKAVKEAAKLNFPLKKGEVTVNFIR
ncbi:MAG: hypothetical protein IT288_06645 [Bdellovibrionales bacterium]|nr:hypothetical protein [Bdellovibrionales bacterium]